MKKRTICLRATVLLIGAVVGCDYDGYTVGAAGSADVGKSEALENRLERVAMDVSDYSVEFLYFRDRVTDVVYVFAGTDGSHGDSGGSLTPLLKPDGTPVLWSEIE